MNSEVTDIEVERFKVQREQGGMHYALEAFLLARSPSEPSTPVRVVDLAELSRKVNEALGGREFT